MKIIFFSPYFYPYTSGITTYPVKLLNHLADKGHQIRVLTFRHQPQLPPSETFQNIAIQRLPYLFKLSKGFISPQSLPTYASAVKWADLVLLNLPSVEGLPLVYLAKQNSKPVLSIFHCMVHLQGSHFSNLLNLAIRQVVLKQLDYSTRIIAYTREYFDSQSLNQYLTKTDFVLPPVETCPADVKFLTQLKQRKGREKWIGFAGRTAREKGLEYLIEALSHLKSNFDSHQIRLVLAGPTGKDVAGESQYFNEIKALMDKYKIKNTFLGNLKSGELTAFYQAIDVLVLPSINQTEAFGMVQAEAMIQGTPVIASDLPGVNYLINQTNLGILIPPKNSKQLAKAIKQILNTPVSEFAIAQAKARELCNNQQVFTYYETLIQSFQPNNS